MLPQYWAVKIDKKHPLWERFREIVFEEYDNPSFDWEITEWKYICKDNKDSLELNMANSLEAFCVDPVLITLEQFFGETPFEIY